MKRDDETFLEYLKRLAREAAAGYGELTDQRLTRARPDVAERRGLLDDEVVEETVIESTETDESEEIVEVEDIEVEDSASTAIKNMDGTFFNSDISYSLIILKNYHLY